MIRNDANDNFRREVRMRQGYHDLMTQTELADCAGIPQSTLSKRLAQPENFTVEELRKLVSAISPDPYILLELIGCPSKEIARMRRAVECSTR